MRKLTIILTVILTLAFLGSALAVPKGKTAEYDSKAGKVIFSGDTHANAGNKCNDCHTKIFQMKKAAFEMKAPHKPGEFCGSCHDGKKAFAQEGNCDKCHKK